MEIKEAIEKLTEVKESLELMFAAKAARENDYKYPDELEALDCALEALGRLVPGRIIPSVTFDRIGFCPKCKQELVIEDEKLHFCPTCGQVLELEA